MLVLGDCVAYMAGGAVFAVKLHGKDPKADGVASLVPHRADPRDS